MTRTGKRNLICDVAGISVGQAEKHAARTGVTVLLTEQAFAAAVDVRGGAPGTIGTEALDPVNIVGAVDAIARRSLQDEMLRIVRTLRTTILFVTHDVEEALHVADRIAVLREGKLVQYAAPEELLRAPASPYVAQLFGVDADLRRYDDLRTALGARR